MQTTVLGYEADRHVFPTKHSVAESARLRHVNEDRISTPTTLEVVTSIEAEITVPIFVIYRNGMVSRIINTTGRRTGICPRVKLRQRITDSRTTTNEHFHSSAMQVVVDNPPKYFGLQQNNIDMFIKHNRDPQPAILKIDRDTVTEVCYDIDQADITRAQHGIYVEEFDIVLYAGDRQNKIVHPYSEAGKRLKAIDDLKTQFSKTHSFFLSLRYVDKTRVHSELFLNMNGVVYQVPIIRENTDEPNGLYITASKEASGYSTGSVADAQVSFYAPDEIPERYAVYETYQDAVNFGNVQAKERAEKDKAHAEAIEKLTTELDKLRLKVAEHGLSAKKAEMIHGEALNAKERECQERIRKAQEDQETLRREREDREFEWKVAQEEYKRQANERSMKSEDRRRVMSFITDFLKVALSVGTTAVTVWAMAQKK